VLASVSGVEDAMVSDTKEEPRENYVPLMLHLMPYHHYNNNNNNNNTFYFVGPTVRY